ncbi:hypothetical protein BDR26DRAFT_1000768 [Obelidium mucronatum]|nr:hypothetical protein BDR26DRAFT_1000768 [Obelidium mucronatum]
MDDDNEKELTEEVAIAQEGEAGVAQDLLAEEVINASVEDQVVIPANQTDQEGQEHKEKEPLLELEHEPEQERDHQSKNMPDATDTTTTAAPPVEQSNQQSSHDATSNAAVEAVEVSNTLQESVASSDDHNGTLTALAESIIQQQTINNTFINHTVAPPQGDFPDISTWVRKRYMGGFRSKKDGKVFFNAFSQTPTAQEIKDSEKSGCHISQVYDYAIRPNPYFSADDHEKLINRKEIESRLHPKTTKDFEILYNGLEHWRIQETETINNAGYSEPARLAALADLMDQEAALIQKIDRLKIAANEENREKGIVKLLENMSSPKKWPVLDGLSAVLVDTPNTIRARELRDLYHALNVAMLSVDERLQILLHVKYTVKEFDCILTREIVELINREGDLVSRGPRYKEFGSFTGLRKRISNLFLQFVQTPEFNPEAAVYQKFPDAGQSWKRDQAVYYCRGCTKYLPSTEFYLSTTMKHLGRCKPCTIKENIATHRKDDSCYGDLLQSMKTQETQKRSEMKTFHEDAHYNAIALLQESDMRHLIDVIWNRQSCISAAKNMDDLVMTRWDPKMEVSPWNCILLTKSEAEKHDKQTSPVDLYTDDFIRKIKQKHLAARRHFSQLPAMERYLKRHYFEDHEGRLIMRAPDH